MADVHPPPGAVPQMPQATSPGSAPVPYQGADVSPEPPAYAVTLGPMSDAAGEVMNGIAPGNSVVESADAHSIDARLADAPYYPGSLSPIYVGGDNDAGGRDDVASSVAQAVANATARWQEYERDILPQGSAYGDLMSMPPNPLDPAASSPGTTDPSGAFYDPPRDYSTDPTI